METKHTPTPWQAVSHSWSTTGIYAKDPAQGGVIAVLCIEGEATEDTQAELEDWMAANATLIVRAVNSHEKLVTALEMVRDADDDAGRDGLPRIPPMARAKIDAALAAAGAA